MRTTNLNKKAIQISNKVRNGALDFFNKKISSSDPLTTVVKSHLYIENILDQIFLTSFPYPAPLLKKKFLDKVDIFRSLDFDSDGKLTELLKSVNSIRNKYSHKLSYRLAKQDLDPFIRILNISRKKRNMSILHHSLGYIISYLGGIQSAVSVFPFLMTCMRSKNIFKDDVGFNYKHIFDTHYPDDLPIKVLESMKIKN